MHVNADTLAVLYSDYADYLEGDTVNAFFSLRAGTIQ